MNVLCAEHLSLGYEGQVIVSDLSFTLEAGNYLCIVGENGSGKTTLMKTLTGLMKPLSGSLIWEEGFSSRDVGYLPQQTDLQKDFPASVREIVRSGCEGRRGTRFFYGRAEKARAEKNMERMGLSSLASRCYRELSGGQQQRVLLARALTASERLLLLDEPVAGLDPKVTAEMYALIADLFREGMTIVMVSHDVAGALRSATHILHIGRQLFFGTTDAYRESRIGRAYLAGAGEEEHG